MVIMEMVKEFTSGEAFIVYPHKMGGSVPPSCRIPLHLVRVILTLASAPSCTPRRAPCRHQLRTPRHNYRCQCDRVARPRCMRQQMGCLQRQAPGTCCTSASCPDCLGEWRHYHFSSRGHSYRCPHDHASRLRNICPATRCLRTRALGTCYTSASCLGCLEERHRP